MCCARARYSALEKDPGRSRFFQLRSEPMVSNSVFRTSVGTALVSMICLSSISDLYFSHTFVLKAKLLKLSEQKYCIAFVLKQTELNRFDFKHPHFGTFWAGVTMLALDGGTKGMRLEADTSALSITSTSVSSRVFNDGGLLFLCARHDLDASGCVLIQCGNERMRPVAEGTSEDLEFVLAGVDGEPVIVSSNYNPEGCSLALTIARSRRIAGE